MPKKYCQECGFPCEKIANYCEGCGKPFPGVTAKIHNPAPPVNPNTARRRQATEHDQHEGDDDDDVNDDSYVPLNLEKLELDIEVYSNRQSLDSLARSPRSSDSFQRPPEKVPRNKADFKKNFLAEFQREAGTSRKK